MISSYILIVNLSEYIIKLPIPNNVMFREFSWKRGVFKIGVDQSHHSMPYCDGSDLPLKWHFLVITSLVNFLEFYFLGKRGVKLVVGVTTYAFSGTCTNIIVISL